MRFDQLKYLDAAVRLGSLRRAAAELGVSQPTLTQQLQRLEEELDIVLLVRRPTGVVPTDAGAILLPHVRQALQAENGLHQEASAISGLHRGRLRLGTIPLGQAFVPRTLRRFREAYPRVNFEVLEGGTGQIRERLLNGELDLGVIARWRDEKSNAHGLHTEDLIQGGYAICVPRGHRLEDRTSVSTSDLAGEAFVVVQRGQLLREAFERIAEQVDATIIYQSNTSESARRTVDAGLGISIQAELGLKADYRSSVAIPLAEKWAHVAICVARREHEQPTPAMNVFTRLIREETTPEPPG